METVNNIISIALITVLFLFVLAIGCNTMEGEGSKDKVSDWGNGVKIYRR